MKIVVIGGAGLIGKKLVANLRERGHDVVPASRSTGIDVMTGEGLVAALAGAKVVVDVTNSPSWEDQAVLEFFETSTRNLLAAEAAAGVGHHIALSVVGTDRMLASGYFRAKMAQENLITAGAIPYSILRATQFFEFVDGIAQFGAQGDVVRLPASLFQPIAAADVAAALAQLVDEPPHNALIDLAGPEAVPMHELIARYLQSKNDPRRVIADASAGYFGTPIDDRSLTPGPNPRLGPTHFDDWLKAQS
jgi:uncharacterized protein YbjT (DUF2867 family)